jgi:hypothetical protein
MLCAGRSLLADRWIVAIFIAGLAFFSGWTAFVVVTDNPVDYYTYVIAAYALTHGINIYLTPDVGYDALAAKLGITTYATPYAYPPLTAMIVWPLTFLPLRIGAAVWVFSSGLAALAAGLLLGAFADSNWKRRLILVASICFGPTLATMYLGQVNAFVLLLTAYALYLFRRNRNAVGGVSLAIGMWLKPLAIGLAALLVWRVRARPLIGAIIASVIIVFIGLAAFGPNLSLYQFSAYSSIARSTVDPSTVAQSAWPGYQNLFAMLSRWFTTHEFGASLMNSPQLALVLYWVIVAMFLVVTLLLLWPHGSNLQFFEMEFALLLMVTFLLSPSTEIHHLSVGFIAFALLIEGWQSLRHLSWEILATASAYVMINIQAVLLQQGFYGQPWQTWLLDFATWGEVIMWALLAFHLKNLRRMKNH